MALTLKTTAISVAFGTASFFMADEDRTVRVDVGQDLLTRVEGPPPKSKSDFAARLAHRKDEFARIATLKYHGGLYKAEVNVLVVRITEADLS
jgi:hypothetical protein